MRPLRMLSDAPEYELVTSLKLAPAPPLSLLKLKCPLGNASMMATQSWLWNSPRMNVVEEEHEGPDLRRAEPPLRRHFLSGCISRTTYFPRRELFQRQ